jgi:ubiquinone/menaquinone biosynthesis C-methylase UbiE
MHYQLKKNIMLKFLLYSFLLSLLACSTSKDISVQKSKNSKFMHDDLDVKLWQEKFENRDRDVYVNRLKIVEQMNIRPSDKVADIGAGTGFFLEPIHKRLGEFGVLWAVDISPGFIKFMESRGEKENLDKLKVLLGSADSSNLASGSIDKVILVNTYHHFDRPAIMLSDLKRVLKSGGELIIVDFDTLFGKKYPWIIKHTKETKIAVIETVNKYFTFKSESSIKLKHNFMLHFLKDNE